MKNQNSNLKPDGLILDMDGTLWDNVDTYVIAWNKGLEAIGHVPNLWHSWESKPM